MKNHIFKVEAKRGSYSAGFYIGILVLTAAGIIGAGDLKDAMGEIDYIGSYVWCTESWYQGMHSEIFIFLLPVACTLPASASYLEDLQNGILMYIMPRTSRKRYDFSKVVNCGLYGGLAAACSLLLLLVVNVIRYPLNNMQFMQWKNMGMSYHMALLENILILCLNGMLYALTGGLVGAITANRYMAYAAPFIFYYVVSTLAEAYLKNRWMLSPKEWMIPQQTGAVETIIFLIVLIIVTGTGYYFKIKRGWENG